MKRAILAAVLALTALGAAAPAAVAQPYWRHHHYWHRGWGWRHPYWAHRRFCYHHPYRC